ncbi:MAG: hypothetical protein V1729_06220 [Candidatus Woesearchaeota archaeon]
MNKKISAILVLAIFLMSMIPMAFAQDEDAPQPELYGENESTAEDTTDDAQATTPRDALRAKQIEARENLREQVQEKAEEIKNESREKAQEKVQELKEDVKEKVQERRAEFRERLSDKEFSPLKRAKATLEKAREKYQNAKENYAQARERYQERRGEFIEAKEQYQSCKGDDSEECLALREDLKEKAKPHLTNVADLILKELERLREKIQSSEDLSEEEVAEITADIDAKIAEIQAAKDEIENLGEDATKEEINAAAKTIKDAWQKAKLSIKKHAARAVNARLGNLVHTTEKLEERLYNARDKLVEKGLDVSALDAKLSDFSSELDNAADLYNQAKALWKDATSDTDVENAGEQVKALLTEAKQALTNAKNMLREVVSEIKSLNNGNLDTVVEEEASEE